MLWQFAQWSEATWLGNAIKDSQYAFPAIEFFHLAALAVLGGAVIVVDLRLLGLGVRKTSVRQLAAEAQPFVTGSLIVMIVSGVALYTSEATKCYVSPAFWIKIISLVLVIIFTYTVRRAVTAAGEERISALARKSVAIVSLGLWFAVAWGGRWIGFGG